MDPQERLTCQDLLQHSYFDMYEKMVDSMKEEQRRQKRSHGNREKNNSRTTVRIIH